VETAIATAFDDMEGCDEGPDFANRGIEKPGKFGLWACSVTKCRISHVTSTEGKKLRVHKLRGGDVSLSVEKRIVCVGKRDKCEQISSAQNAILRDLCVRGKCVTNCEFFRLY
jgi:hypothetical protein